LQIAVGATQKLTVQVHMMNVRASKHTRDGLDARYRVAYGPLDTIL